MRMCVCVCEGRKEREVSPTPAAHVRYGAMSTHSVVTVVACGFVDDEQHQSHDEAWEGREQLVCAQESGHYSTGGTSLQPTGGACHSIQVVSCL